MILIYLIVLFIMSFFLEYCGKEKMAFEIFDYIVYIYLVFVLYKFLYKKKTNII